MSALKLNVVYYGIDELNVVYRTDIVIEVTWYAERVDIPYELVHNNLVWLLAYNTTECVASAVFVWNQSKSLRNDT